MKQKLCDPRVKEENENLYIDIQGTKYFVDTGADISVSTEPLETNGTIHVQTYDGQIKTEKTGEKYGITMIEGSENLLAAKDLKKVLRLKPVNYEQELQRIENEIKGSQWAKEQLMAALRKTPYGRSKNDCGKVSDKFAHVIEGGIHKPQRQYPINKKGLAELNITLQELEEQGVIKRVKGAITNSPIQLAAKPDGTFRFITNFRALNRLTRPDKRYLINARDTVEKIRDGRFYSKIDLANGFYAIPLAEESQEKTAFTANQNHYVYRRLPQGYLNSPIFFQATLAEILSGLDVELYIDDILLVSNGEREHVQLVTDVLKRLAEAGLKINIKKTQLMTDMVEFLGFWISAGNRGVTQSMKDRVNQIETPKTVRQVQQTMGLLGYVRDLIPRFSQMSKPIYATIKGGRLKWTEKAEEALTELKTAILNSGQLEGRNDEKNLEADLETDEIGYQLIVRNEKRNIPVRILSGNWENPELKFTCEEKQLAALSKRYSELKGLARKYLLTQKQQCWLISPKTKLKTPVRSTADGKDGKICYWIQI